MTETDEAPKRGRPPKAKTIPFRIMRDFWDEDGNRHGAGGVIELTAEEALDQIETGALERVK